jgi:hypothetical protein
MNRNLVIPDPGKEESVARTLLGVASSPYEVQTNTDAGVAFMVSDAVADAYEALYATPETEQPAEPEPAPEAPKRRTRKAKEES